MIKLKKTMETAKLPEYANDAATGADCFLPEDVRLSPGLVTMVDLGLLLCDCPYHIELQIRMRSGWAKKGVMLANGIGSVDSDYRGNLKVLLFNSTPVEIALSKGDRIVQLVPAARLQHHKFEWSDIVCQTKRGEGGFGHTGD